MASAAIKTITYEDFSAGIDLREGGIVRDSRKFLDLENYLTTFGRKLVRRPPFDELNGELDELSQGLGYLNGRFIAIAKAGDTVAHTIAGITVETIYFDNPDYCTDWTLIDAVSLNEVIVAAIRHVYPGGAVSSRIILHVWDNKRPTWVEDPACPTNWTKQFPLNAYGIGELGEYKDYTPTLAIVADKVHMTRPDGNTAYSGVNKPRVWGNRDANDILDNGRWWYFITPEGSSIFEFIIPVKYEDLSQAQKYAAYVCERMFANGSWRQFREQGTLIQSGDYTISAVPNRYDPLKGTETKIRILWNGGPGRIIRFRALARPAVRINAGLVLTPAGTVTGGSITIEGASHDIPPFNVLSGLAATSYYHVVVPAPSAQITMGTAFLGVLGSMPLNGQQRYWSRIIAVAETNGGVSGFDFDFTGTVDTLVGQTSVVGTGTAFLTDAIPGERIQVEGEVRTISGVRSDLRLDVSAPWSITETGVIALRDIGYQYANEIGDVGNEWYATRESEAAFVLAGASNAGVLNTSLYDPSGQVPLALGAAQNRLLVQYPETIQLWGVQPDPTLNAHLATVGIGSGRNTAPRAALVDGYIVLPTNTGPRMFAPDGQNKDYIKDVPIGDLIYRTTKDVNFQNAVWWPRLRLYVTCAASEAEGNLTLWAFAYHPQDKTSSWARFTIEGLTSVDKLFVAQDTLYILSGRKVWRANVDSALYRDSSDEDLAYQSKARWLFNDFGAPAYNKKLLTFDIGQVGTSRVSMYSSPYRPDEADVGPDISGETVGQQRLPIGLLTPGVGLEITSRDETGHLLDFVGFTYDLMRR